ncbi:MAG TPA: hypothetical protein VKV16_11510 [Solirubrobacteraceae bacterium]|nr:hypothetical protein [Solirubrobacteraceae bacterium]
MRTPRHLLLLLLTATLVAALAGGLLETGVAAAGKPSAAHSSSAHKASRGPSYLTGIGNEEPKMFKSSLWKQLKTKIVRYVAPYDAVAHPYSLRLAAEFIQAAEAAHQQVLVAFYHSEYTPTKLPSLATYQRDVQKFIKLFPHVRQYEAWDESNRGNEKHVFSSPSAVQTAKYYQQLIRVCHGCSVVGLDILDAQYIGPTLEYISEFKREIYRLETVMPKIWGLHNYSDINRLESWRTNDLVHALGGQVWLTETGGIVKFGGSFPNKHGSGLKRAAKVLKYMFGVAGAHAKVTRLYIYDWNGGTASTRFDAGLTNAKEQPREGYVVVCKQLHGAKCKVKVADN